MNVQSDNTLFPSAQATPLTSVLASVFMLDAKVPSDMERQLILADRRPTPHRSPRRHQDRRR
jgi:hypothetical protein